MSIEEQQYWGRAAEAADRQWQLFLERAERDWAEAEAKAWLGAIGALRDEARLTREVRERWQRHQSTDASMNAQVGFLLDQVVKVVELAEGRQP